MYNKKYELTAIYLSGRFLEEFHASGKGGSITHVFVINACLVITGPTGTVNEQMFSQLLIVSSISMYCPPLLVGREPSYSVWQNVNIFVCKFYAHCIILIPAVRSKFWSLCTFFILLW